MCFCLHYCDLYRWSWDFNQSDWLMFFGFNSYFEERTTLNFDLFNFYKEAYEILMVITFSTPSAGTYNMCLSRWGFTWASKNIWRGLLVYSDPFCGGDIQNNRNSNILYASSLSLCLGVNLYKQQWEAAWKFALCKSAMTEFWHISIPTAP